MVTQKISLRIEKIKEMSGFVFPIYVNIKDNINSSCSQNEILCLISALTFKFYLF